MVFIARQFLQTISGMNEKRQNLETKEQAERENAENMEAQRKKDGRKKLRNRSRR